MAYPGNQPQPNGIAHAIIAAKLLPQAVVTTCQNAAQELSQNFIQYLIEKHLLSAHQIAHACASTFGVPLLDLAQVTPAILANHLLDINLLQRHRVLPLYQRGTQLFLAVEDPTQQELLHEIHFHTGLHTHAIVVESDKLAAARAAITTVKTTLAPVEDNEQPVKFVNKIVADAVKRRASDIHCESYENWYRIRYRIDGLLYEIATPPPALASQITARLKIMANLDIAERRLPQDGRFNLPLNAHNNIDCRISTCPTVNGEKVVLRLLDQRVFKTGIATLGLNDAQQQLFEKILLQPQGLILVTGPTGSGKTVTLYSALNFLNQTTRNISTVEDPIEIKLHGINQVNVNYKTGLGFAKVLRTLLRQDPDVIMIGEIRDDTTAAIAVKAAQTGHLVLATLHTNNAVASLSRLMQLGVTGYNLAASVSLIIAQRLVRRLCEHCRTLDNTLPEVTLYQANSCTYCDHGYSGRIGIFEVLHITPAIRELLVQDNTLAISRLATGITDLRHIGMLKVIQGTTTLAEIMRVVIE